MKNLSPKCRWVRLLAGFTLVLLKLSLTGVHAYSEPTQPHFVPRHIVIAQDISGSVTKHKELLERIREYLDGLLFMGCGSIQLNYDDHLDDPFSFSKEPLWRVGDAITILTFGMEEMDIKGIPSGDEYSWVKEFSNKLVARNSCLYSLAKEEVRNDLKNNLRSVSRQSKNYTLSRYLYPFCLSKLPENVYAKETILIAISDFRYGDDQHNIGDREVITHFAGKKLLDRVEEKWSDLQQTFSLSSPLFSMNVGRTKGIFIQGRWIMANSPLKGEFMSLPSALQLARLPDESSYPFPNIKFRRQDTSQWTAIQYMGVCGKSVFPPRFIYEVPVAKGNEFLIDRGKISIVSQMKIR